MDLLVSFNTKCYSKILSFYVDHRNISANKLTGLKILKSISNFFALKLGNATLGLFNHIFSPSQKTRLYF